MTWATRVRATAQAVAGFIGSRWFWYAIVGLFALEAGWLAIVSAYPMAFDESYHMGLIQFFSHHLQPVITHQPASSYPLGPIQHNPTFLYHYLMSFPYRWLTAFTDDVRTVLVYMRLLNVAMVVASFAVIRALLRLLNVRSAVANIAILLLAFTPAVAQVAAQLNYDNLLLLCSVGAGYMTLRVIRSLKQGTVPARWLAGLVAVCAFGNLVKFSFLPISAGIAFCVGWALVRYQRRDARAGWWRTALQDLGQWSIANRFVVGLAVTVGVGLSGYYFGYALLHYHNPVPQCNQVLSVAQCHFYPPWERNYTVTQQFANTPRMHIWSYTFLWVRATYYQMFAEIVPGGGLVPVFYPFYPIVMGLTLFATVCALVRWRRIIFGHPGILTALAIAAVYCFFLWMRNYHDYMNIGQLVAIQGRYLTPVLVYLYVAMALGVYYIWQKIHWLHSGVVAAATGLVIVSFLYFGGTSQYRQTVSPTHGWSTTPPGLLSAHTP